MKNITIIASAFKAENDLLTNYVNHKQAIQALDNFGLKAKEAIGRYEGVQGLSLVIELDGFIAGEITRVKRLFFDIFEQDAILLINGLHASLIFPEAEAEDLGTFHKVPEAEAKKYGAFTFMDGEYWVSKEEMPELVWGERQSRE